MMKYFHVDVFAEQAMNGNGLTVVFPQRELPSETLLKIAQEFKQFETIFIYPPNEDGSFPVRIFTIEEGLATGSAVGPLCAYLVRNGFAEPDQVITISQGTFLNRPSFIKGWVLRETGHVFIQGNVTFFGKGEIFI